MMKLWEVMGKKAMEIVLTQYQLGGAVEKVVLEPTIVNFKKTLELLELCHPLNKFVSTLEKRDKKYLITFSQIIEIEPKVNSKKKNLVDRLINIFIENFGKRGF